MNDESDTPKLTVDEIIKAKDDALALLLHRKSSLKDRFSQRKKEIKQKYRDDLKNLESEMHHEASQIKADLEKLGIKARRGRPEGISTKTTKRKKRVKLGSEEIKEKLKAFMQTDKGYKCEELFNHLNIARQDFMEFFLNHNAGTIVKKGETKSTRYFLA